MSDNCLFDRDFLRDFIAIYRSYPCLWKVKSKHYSNKNLKAAAYDALVEKCKEVFANADRDFVIKKINTMRGSFRKALKKVKASSRSGAGSDVYVPSLWYYDLLSFTADQEIARDSTLNITNEEDSESSEDTEEASCSEADSILNQVHSQSRNNITECSTLHNRTNETYHRSSSVQHVGRPAKKKTRTEMSATNTASVNEFSSQAYAVLAKQDDEFDAYGITVAAKLRRMDENQRLYAENVIQQAIFKGMMGILTASSEVTTPDAPATTVPMRYRPGASDLQNGEIDEPPSPPVRKLAPELSRIKTEPINRRRT